MRRRRCYARTIVVLGSIPLALAAGCATARRPSPAVARVAAPASQPTGPAILELDEILPRPVLASATTTTAPTTNPAARPPLDALVLFARARELMLDGRRSEAARLLEQAVALDPGSYELHYALARAYRAGMAYDARSIAELEKAAAIEPDHLDVQLDLGRQYLARGDGREALNRLRLALQTKDYKANDPRRSRPTCSSPTRCRASATTGPPSAGSSCCSSGWPTAGCPAGRTPRSSCRSPASSISRWGTSTSSRATPPAPRGVRGGVR